MFFLEYPWRVSSKRIQLAGQFFCVPFQILETKRSPNFQCFTKISFIAVFNYIYISTNSFAYLYFKCLAYFGTFSPRISLPVWPWWPSAPGLDVNERTGHQHFSPLFLGWVVRLLADNYPFFGNLKTSRIHHHKSPSHGVSLKYLKMGDPQNHRCQY